jgi:hypothetical protein
VATHISPNHFAVADCARADHRSLLHTDGGLLVPDDRDARKRFEELEETLRVLEEEKASNTVSLKRGSSDCDIST